VSFLSLTRPVPAASAARDRRARLTPHATTGKEEIRMKLWCATWALVVFALPAGFAQERSLAGKLELPDVPDVIKTERTIEILQVQPCLHAPPGDPRALQLPAGVTDVGFCLAGPDRAFSGARPEFEAPACRFVGSILCLDPGSQGDFASFLTDCPPGTMPVLQGIKLRKVEPRVKKCLDVFPGLDFTQTGVSGIRTWWPLKFTPCDTTFTLDLEIGCVGAIRDPHTGTTRQGVVQVRLNRFIFKVTVRPESLRWVIEALHCQPLGLCEVPCITDEALFAKLLQQADKIQDAAADAAMGRQARLRDLNDLLDHTEALIVKYCFFTHLSWEFDYQNVLHPCVLFDARGRGFLPGNKTIGDFGFGIVDTLENPCCCKLIDDIVCLKRHLIGTDP
jgi:hypothetical protein